MKQSDKFSLVSIGLGIAAALLFAWWWPGLGWYVYAFAGAVVASGAYGGLMRDAAARNIADRGS